MVEALLALVVETDVVGCPVAAELLASGRELADQLLTVGSPVGDA
jgi:hypothetical protein